MLVKDIVRLVCLFQNVGLDQFENVASDCFHWFEHRIVLGLLRHYSIRDLLRVEVVDFEQVLKYVLQVIEVDVARAFSYALVDLDNVIDRFDVVMMEKLIHVHVCIVQLRLEVLM